MKDQLSALIDGEFELESAAHLITMAKSVDEMQRCWANYHLIGDVMRGDNAMSADFTSRVVAALESEPKLAQYANEDGNDNQSNISVMRVKVKPVQKKSIFNSMPIWSVAASVAAVMFVGYMVLQQNNATTQLAPIEIAQSLPLEYLQAHRNAMPNAAAYYMQTAYAETSNSTNNTNQK